MRKIKNNYLWSLLVAVLFPVILVGCIPAGLFETTDEIKTGDDTAGEAPLMLGANGFPMIGLTDEARDIALEDFDYLAVHLLENVPAQIVIDRNFGISLAEILDFLRDNIYYQEPIECIHFLLMGQEDPPTVLPTDPRENAAQYLSSLLFWLTIDLQGLGHLSPQTLEAYHEMLEIHLAILHQMEEVDGRMMVGDEDMGSIRSLPWIERRADAFSAEASLWFYGLTMDDINLYREMDDFGFREEGNVTTEIIEEGRIAYIQIDSFMNNRAFDSEILFPFYEEVQNFEHLIIDLRGNGGGTLAYLDYIISMLISETLEASYHEFLMAGELVYLELGDEEVVYDDEDTVEVLEVAEFMAAHDFPYFNESALDLLHYVITWPLVYEPREDNIPFAGEIWILVDGGSASLSEMLAMIAIDSGFATVVGHPTAGITPAMHTYVSLPNTGIVYRMDIGYIIDVYGRSLEEYGVTPDVLIGETEDALDVVLGLIN